MKRLLGYLSLLGLIITWISQSEVAQYLQTTSSYNKPLFITWCNHSWGIVLIPVQWLHYRLRIMPDLEKNEQGESCGWFEYLRKHQGVKVRRLVGHCSWLSVIFLLGDYFWYIGLAYTSVAAGTTIFNSSCVFVYVFSVIFGLERLKMVKVVAVLLAVSGVAVVSFFGHRDTTSTETSHTLVGNLFVLVAAAGYGIYEVLLKKHPLESGRIDDAAVVNTITGILSFFNLAVLWVAIPLVQCLPHGLFREQFEAPAGQTLTFLIINGLLALLFNIFLMLSVALTSPLTVSVGCMLTIPISGVTDVLLHHTQFPPLAFVGSSLVFSGFSLLTYSESTESDAELVANEDEENEEHRRENKGQMKVPFLDANDTTPL